MENRPAATIEFWLLTYFPYNHYEVSIMSVAIKVEGFVSPRLLMPHVTVELFLKGDTRDVSESVQSHGFSTFKPNSASTNPGWFVNFKKLKQNQWYYVITTYRSGGANGMTMHRTVSAQKTGTPT